MTRTNEMPASPPVQPLEIRIGATFTAEPLAEALGFWMAELGLDAELAFAPHGQVFQQLLGAHDQPDADRARIQVLLVRLADWLEPAEDAREEAATPAGDLVGDLCQAVRSSVSRHADPHLVFVCPSPEDADRRPRAAEPRLADELRDVAGVQVVSAAELETRYPVADWHDAYAQQTGRVPYTREGFAALGTMIARTVHAHLTPRPKVIAVDGDGTLWDGVLAEDGPSGVSVPPARRELQELLVGQVRAGRLVCLCTRNDPADVATLLQHHPGMVLRAEDVTAIRANWQPKSVNLRSLAEELGLGLDGFVFVDDSPLEVAEVRASTPAVTALHLPAEPDAAAAFLRHCWVLDHPRVTAEDAARTRAYQQHRQREQARGESLTLAEFMDRLELDVTIRPPGPADADRVAQLTQRVNQFNLSGVRRTVGQVARLADEGLECLVVDVSDRFGAYGLVGVLVFADAGDTLRVDTFLLSCRALGRGVEHRMLAHLGALAGERGLAEVVVPYSPAARNAPALDFLAGLGGRWRDRAGYPRQLRLPAEGAAAARYDPDVPAQPIPTETASAGGTAAPPDAPAGSALLPAASEQVSRIATELATAAQVLAAAGAWRAGGSSGPVAPGGAAVAPRTPLEAKIVELWSALLPTPPRSVHDNFFELGGDSLMLVQFMGQVRRELGVELPVTVLFESDFVIADVAAAVEEAQLAGGAAAADPDDLDDLVAELRELPAEDLDAVLRGD